MLTIITGPTASGKTTRLKALRDDFKYIILPTYTTRKKRVDDIEEQYMFVDSINLDTTTLIRETEKYFYAVDKALLLHALQNKNDYAIVLDLTGSEQLVACCSDYIKLDIPFLTLDLYDYNKQREKRLLEPVSEICFEVVTDYFKSLYYNFIHKTLLREEHVVTGLLNCDGGNYCRCTLSEID